MVATVATAARAARRVPAILRRRAFLVPFALAMLAAHFAGMMLRGFTQGGFGVAILLAFLGFLAVPFCGWEASRFIDWFLQRALKPTSFVGALIRVLLGAIIVVYVPQLYSLLGEAPLPQVQRIIEITAVFLSIAVVSGLILIGLGLADVLYAVTGGFRHVSTKIIVLLLVTSIGTILWFTYLGSKTQDILHWALERGHLQNYATRLDQLDRFAGAWTSGVLAGAISLQLPFTILFAWRFGKNATVGIETLRDGFERVAEGDLDEAIDVEGNDEIAGMQRGFNEMLRAARERRFLETAFGRYVSPVVLERLRGQGAIATERRVATVMFTDIRGFTALSAQLSPEAVIALLNRYMSLLIDVVARHDGYINKFIGDAIVVVWNAPLDQPDHAQRAVRCALDMQTSLRAANDANAFGERRVEMGVGINTGDLVMGNLGNDRVVEFAIIGDTVNVASRCCSKAGPGQIAVTQAVVDGAKQAALYSSMGPVELKGKGAVELFEVKP